jgi:lipopolysaccharide transport system ATP-binding protein
MSKHPILKVENVSKQYRLGLIGTGTISHDLNRWWHKIRGKEDPFLKVGETNDRSQQSDSKYVWALKDIDFEVEPGEVLGIIGKNGAGKSTLLKILSQVTGPTTGTIKSKGRIASLLEVGTGFHPEMTGKENIFLNGAILGMTKKEINEKLDEIVSFSGCERYIDTPVKRYSSGMKVRLAFAVAAHLEPDILVVDEVLAVGDLEFQKKAIGKMQSISNQHGRTVLFVSHNMAAVKLLCTRAMVLDKGMIAYMGNVDEALIKYKDLSTFASDASNIEEFSNDSIALKSISAKPHTGQIITIDSGVDFEIVFESFLEGVNLDCTLEIVNSDEVVIYHKGALVLKDKDSKKGTYTLRATMPKNLLNSGIYKVNLIFGKDQQHLLLGAKSVLEIDISTMGSTTSIPRPGIIYQDFDWKVSFKK